MTFFALFVTSFCYAPVVYHSKVWRKAGISDHGDTDKGSPVIWNPLTTTFIDQTSPSWVQLMHHQGGYVAHSGVLMPIDLDALVEWEAIKGSDQSKHIGKTTYDLTTYYDHMKNDDWTTISANFIQSNWTSTMDATAYPSPDQLLFVYKPTRMLTLPGIGIDKVNCLASDLNTWLYNSQEGETLMKMARSSSLSRTSKGKKSRTERNAADVYAVRPCHRLDYDTSGVVAVALTPQSHRKTSILFENRLISKSYVALVAGHVTQNGSISFPIGKVRSLNGNYHEFACYTGTNGLDMSDFVEGSLREATTEYIVTNRFTVPTLSGDTYAKYTRIILKPVTGRGHQLRLHCAAINHPILGDTLHSDSREVSSCTPRLCLHAEELCIPTSVKNNVEMMSIKSIAPF